MKYRIENVREAREIDRDGNTVDLMEIQFEIEHKYRGRVLLPLEGFTEKSAKQAVRKKVLELTALMEFEEEI